MQIQREPLVLMVINRLPILILASTVDRNLVSADAIREKLNTLVDDVRLALLDPEVVAAYMRDTRTTPQDFEWTKCLGDDDKFGEDFFEGFAGQGRSHWHYGGQISLCKHCWYALLMVSTVAHPILAGIEAKFMADYCRSWLLHGHAARLAIVVESRNVNGLKMFDPRMAWQITSSMILVIGTVGGSFIISCKLLTI